MDQPKMRPGAEEEVFRRVWQRVMAGRGEDSSPIRVDDTVPEVRPAAMGMTLPADRPGSDLPPMGTECAPEGITAHLRRQTQEMLEGWQFYRCLARRTRGSAGQTLAALAAEQHQLARKLAAAYFLRSGVRYWPVDQLAAPTIRSYWGALRRRHQEEQQGELDFRMAADEAEDAALTELYGQLAESCRAHCRKLHILLEQSCP